MKTRLAVLLLGVAMLPAYAWDRKGMPEPGMSFKDHDTNRDGYLSMNEFKAKGKDDLAFKAADIDGDERVDPSEFDKHLIKKATDPKSESGAYGQPKPVQLRPATKPMPPQEPAPGDMPGTPPAQ